MVDEYTKEYVKIICDAYFKNKHIISGEEITSLVEIQQINFLIFQLIFENWKKQFDKVKSPYFDYQHSEVTNSKNAFMSVLSKHISIERKEFESLFSSATNQTLELLFSPQQYYINLFQRLGNEIDLSEYLPDLMKYVIIHKSYKNGLFNKLKSSNQKKISTQIAIDLCKNFRFEENFDNPKNIITLFNKTLRLYPEELFPNWKSYLNLNIQKPSFINDLEKEITTHIELDERQKNRAKLFETSEEDIKKSSVPEFVSQKEEKQKQVKEITSISSNENYSLKIASNEQQLNFKNQLFKGNSQEMMKALITIEKCTDYHMAIKLIKEKYITAYQWDISSSAVADLLKIIDDYFD